MTQYAIIQLYKKDRYINAIKRIRPYIVEEKFKDLLPQIVAHGLNRFMHDTSRDCIIKFEGEAYGSLKILDYVMYDDRPHDMRTLFNTK